MSTSSRKGGTLSRRDIARLTLGLGAAALSPPLAAAQTGTGAVITKPIPGTGEAIPPVGLGTASVFDNVDESTTRAAQQVVEALISGGGRLIDTASTYGDSEVVLGNVMASAGLRDKIFIATKLESPNAAELKRSLARLKTEKVDLLQLHNVSNPNQSLAKFRDWKAQGICRYIGITSTYHGDFGAVEAVMRREKPDFVQVDYSLADRTAERRILPLAIGMKAAVLTAIPLGQGQLFRTVRGKSVPEWAADFDATSWAQFFLKFLLGHPAVTAVIPATANPAHMADNVGAARGRLPDEAQRKRMVEFIQSV
jgi:aryl-alcohol dehydrogenase-like predicted oxidoreductase